MSDLSTYQWVMFVLFALVTFVTVVLPVGKKFWP